MRWLLDNRRREIHLKVIMMIDINENGFMVDNGMMSYYLKGIVDSLMLIKDELVKESEMNIVTFIINRIHASLEIYNENLANLLYRELTPMKKCRELIRSCYLRGYFDILGILICELEGLNKEEMLKNLSNKIKLHEKMYLENLKEDFLFF